MEEWLSDASDIEAGTDDNEYIEVSVTDEESDREDPEEDIDERENNEEDEFDDRDLQKSKPRAIQKKRKQEQRVTYEGKSLSLEEDSHIR